MRDNTIFKIILLSLFAFLLLSPLNTFSQSTGSIGGRVTDAKDNTPLIGATIKIEGSKMGAITDDNGEYVILNVDVGVYGVECSYMGYDTKRQKDIRVSVDQRTKANFELSTGEIVTKVIEVEGERKGIDVDQSGRIIESSTIKNTGIRGVTNIVSKTAGVVQDERGGSINIRGGRSNESIIIIDGVETTNPIDGTSRAFVSNNLLQEITVLTGGFGAEYGNVLSGVINVSTKSGTDVYTGSVELITDEFAGRWFDTKSQGYNLYSLTFGGPVIPSKKLANVINFFGGFERTFQRITDVSWTWDRLPLTVPDGNVKSDESGSYYYTGKLNFNLNELGSGKFPFNFKFGGTYTDVLARSIRFANNIQNDYKNPITDTKNTQLYGRVIGNISSNFFFELQGNYYRDQYELYDPFFGDNLLRYGDTNYNPGLNAYYQGAGQGKTLGYDPAYSYLYRFPWATIDAYTKQDISYIGAKLDATLALLSKKYGDHEIKFGGEYRYNSLKSMTLNPASLADLSVQNTGDRWYGTNLARLKTYGYEIIDPITGALVANGNDTKHPITGGFYVRDKVSFNDFNFNGGFRVDFFDVNTKVLKSLTTDVVGPDGIPASADDFTDSKMNFYFSPRLGFSFPITDRTIFVAQFGKMVQLPQLSLLYVSDSTLKRFLSTSLQDVIENSSLSPTKLTQYEIGVKQQVGDYINMGMTIFYKESTDLIGAGRIKQTEDKKVPIGFAAYMNNDFAISRGIDCYLSMRRMYRLAIDVAYTLAYASGTGSNAFSKFSLANDPTQELVNYVYALDYDQRHTGSINFDYRFGSDDVPKGILGDILKNLGLNALLSFNSGRPYTRTDVANTATGTGGDNVLSAKNEIYRSWNFRIDLRLDKTVNIWKTNLNMYVYVLNLLNSEIVNAVYTGTGLPDDNG
ncbi:MAG: TonB-dependent receptor, partial [Ignavibacteria bacterium]